MFLTHVRTRCYARRVRWYGAAGAIGAGLGAILHNQVGGVIALLAWGLVVDNLLFGLVPSVGGSCQTVPRTHSGACESITWSRPASTRSC